MTFAWPHLFWLLLVPLALAVWDLTHRRRAAATAPTKILRAEAGANSLTLASGKSDRASGRPPRLWLALGLALAVCALTRPQWGRIDEPVFDQSREILLAVDLSRSMLSQDVRPSRLERSKLLIQSLLERLQGERVGLVVFSGTAFLQSPLSADYEILREFLPALGPDYLPEGGTNYRALLETSLAAFGSTGAADRFLVILSDGEATDEDWKPLAEDLKKKGIRVIALGVGTESGAMIPDGAGAFVKDDRGAVVLSKLESATLRELAQVTNGVYTDASSWIDLGTILSQTVEAGRKGEFLEKSSVRLVERFQWPLAFAVWCLLVSFYYEFPVRPRPRDLRLTPTPAPRPPATGPRPEVAAATTVALFGVLLSLVGIVSTARAEEPSLLGKIVGRLSAQPEHSARDWADLAGETATWGRRLQSEQHPVPEGPVRDALAAAELGAQLDAHAADWAKLRSDLQALLKKPDEQKKPEDQKQQQKPQDQKQDQDKKDQDQQQKDDQKNQPQDQKGQKDSKDQKGQQQDKSDQQKSDEQKNGDQPKDQGKDQKSAFGDMKDKTQPPPPPPSGDMQKVGGAPEKKEVSPADGDPSLALPLQKLDQLRNQDSPAKLFQLMQGETQPTPPKKGKNW